MIVSLAEGAKLAGVSRQTIYRKAKSGELSTTRRHDDSKGVDTSELERVFGTITVQEPHVTPETAITVTADTESDAARQGDTERFTALERDLAAAQTTIKHQDERIAELKSDKDKLWNQVESQRLLLEHKDQPQPEGVSWPLVVMLGMVGVALAVITYMAMR